MVYTDGSFKKDTKLTGSGIYGFKDGTEVRIRVRPSKPSPVHTINRAEMIAIHEALRHWEQCDIVNIATDSANAMKNINKQLRNPQKHNKHVYKNLLEAIAKLLLSRARQGLFTSLLKVKSHIGIHGNEIADQLAGEATESWEIHMSNQLVEPYNDMPWLRSITKDDHSNDCEGPFLRDLNDSLKTVVHDQQRLGQTNQQAKYVQYWGEVLKHIRQDISSSYWEEEHKVTDAMLRNTNKYKWGQIWNMGKAWLWQVPYFQGGAIQ